MDISTTVRDPRDVIVVGGGIAGVCAAVAAARAGASVLLIEKSVNLGGLATVGLISWYEPLCDGEGHKMLSGLCEELIRLAVSCGFDTLPAVWGGDAHRGNENSRYACNYSPTFFALALDRLVIESGAELLFDTRATYPVMEEGLCKGVIVENVNGRELYPAKVVIDATGDATLMHRAGVPCETGQNYLSYVAHGFDRRDTERFSESGDLHTLRRWIWSGSDMLGNGHPQGMKYFVGDSAEEITEFMLIGKQRMLDKFRDSDKNGRELMMIPTIPQYRMIRRIVGDTVFHGTEQDYVFADAIGSCGDFRRRGRRFTIPYSALYNSRFPNLLAAGRIVSAEGDGWEITRVIPVCALTGEAAGIAAALAVELERSPATLPYPTLRERLARAGVAFAI